MYKIQLIMTNPLTGDATILVNQFDPATMTQTKWNSAWSTVSGSMAALVSGSTSKEPPTW